MNYQALYRLTEKFLDGAYIEHACALHFRKPMSKKNLPQANRKNVLIKKELRAVSPKGIHPLTCIALGR